MNKLVEDTQKALLKTVDLLSTEFRVYSWDFLPYEALAIILSYVHAKIGNTLSPNQATRVRQWFWRSAFTERYRGLLSISSLGPCLINLLAGQAASNS